MRSSVGGCLRSRAGRRHPACPLQDPPGTNEITSVLDQTVIIKGLSMPRSCALDVLVKAMDNGVLMANRGNFVVQPIGKSRGIKSQEFV